MECRTILSHSPIYLLHGKIEIIKDFFLVRIIMLLKWRLKTIIIFVFPLDICILKKSSFELRKFCYSSYQSNTFNLFSLKQYPSPLILSMLRFSAFTNVLSILN